MKPHNSILIYCSIFFLFILVSIGCEDKTGVPASYERGEVISSTNIGSYSTAFIQQIVSSSNVTLPFSLVYSVNVKSITYSTVDRNGNQVIASGALMIPSGAASLPLISLQHGTETNRNLVASQSPLSSSEGMVGLISTSVGYVTAIPDYLGFGVSEIPHPYLHANSLIPSVIDFIRAARSYCNSNGISLNGDVFLTGYSEGGFATLAIQRKIESEYSEEFNLVAVAPMAGPYDLYGTVQAGFQAGQYGTPAYLAYFFTAYDDIYGWNRLNDIFNAPYSSRMRTLFDGSKTWGEIINQLPSTFSQLMNPTFVNNVINGNELNFIAALQENTLLDWNPTAPINFIHGDADDIVPFHNALTAVDRLEANGSINIQLTTIPGGTHESAGPIAAIIAIQWFEQFK